LDHRAWRDVDGRGAENDRTQEGGSRPPAALTTSGYQEDETDLQILWHSSDICEWV